MWKHLIITRLDDPVKIAIPLAMVQKIGECLLPVIGCRHVELKEGRQGRRKLTALVFLNNKLR